MASKRKKYLDKLIAGDIYGYGLLLIGVVVMVAVIAYMGATAPSLETSLFQFADDFSRIDERVPEIMTMERETYSLTDSLLGASFQINKLIGFAQLMLMGFMLFAFGVMLNVLQSIRELLQNERE